MPSFTFTDNVTSAPVPGIKFDPAQFSALARYAKSQALHMAVVPDFLDRKDQPLSQAAASPLRFDIKLGNDFELGGEQTEITLSPKVSARLIFNAAEGSDLFADDPFRRAAEVPAGTGFAGFRLGGSLNLGIAGSAGDLSFGFDAGGSITIEFLKAFAKGAGEPTVAEATSQMLSGFLIPSNVDDLQRMQVHDVCAVSGEGSLQVSGGFTIATPVNCLASVSLPVHAGALSVQNGAMAGVSASFTISGSYQIRVRRLAGGSIELSYLRERGTEMEVGFKASAAVTSDFHGIDPLTALMTAISKNGPDPEILKSLTADEAATFSAAICEGTSHSIAASVSLALSRSTDDQATFQYEIDLNTLDDFSRAAVNRALRGDLTMLTAREDSAAADGTIAPGIKLLNSVLTRTRERGVTFKVNLLGIVNLFSISKLVSTSEFLVEPASGDLTIKETAQSERISAISEPIRRQEALRKALFESVLVTATYRAGQVIDMPELDCECMHFVLNRDTSRDDVRGYLNWFAALGLITQAESTSLLGQYAGDKTSSCVLRAAFDDATCRQLFFEEAKLRDKSYYLQFGRQALKAMLSPSEDAVGRIRYQVLDDDARWKKALDDGPTPALREVIPLSSTDAHFNLALALVQGDLYDIVWWAESMIKAGKALDAMRQFLAGRDVRDIKDDPDFVRLRDALQKTMLKVVADSKARFDLPWGLTALYWSAGSPAGAASGKISAGAWTMAKP